MDNIKQPKIPTKNDPSFAWTWHCNLACAAMDEGVSHELSNKIAARIMNNFFGIDVTKYKEYKVK